MVEEAEDAFGVVDEAEAFGVDEAEAFGVDEAEAFGVEAEAFVVVDGAQEAFGLVCEGKLYTYCTWKKKLV